MFDVLSLPTSLLSIDRRCKSLAVYCDSILRRQHLMGAHHYYICRHYFAITATISPVTSLAHWFDAATPVPILISNSSAIATGDARSRQNYSSKHCQLHTISRQVVAPPQYYTIYHWLSNIIITYTTSIGYAISQAPCTRKIGDGAFDTDSSFLPARPRYNSHDYTNSDRPRDIMLTSGHIIAELTLPYLLDAHPMAEGLFHCYADKFQVVSYTIKSAFGYLRQC
jgi:hypothetical protein